MSTFVMLLLSVGIPSFVFALMSGVLLPANLHQSNPSRDMNPLRPHSNILDQKAKEPREESLRSTSC